MQVSQAFAEMMFKHGFVHCDPHAANLLVRPLPSSKRSILGEASLYVKLLFKALVLIIYIYILAMSTANMPSLNRSPLGW